ncbi:MAG: DUF3575 domain-containing protein [Porphyromonas sp.]|nr:DUF3575 domain-containing protein [Porphyromonas sp.]
MKRYPLLFFLLLINTLVVKAQSQNDHSLTQSDSLLLEAYKWYPKYVTFLPSNKIDSVLSYSYTEIIPIIFEVNRAVLKENDELRNIVSTINRLKKDKRVKISYVWIGGSASPEGSIENNRKLGESRSKILCEYLKRETSLTNEEIRVENLWEDWALLVHILRDKNIPNKDKIIEIISNEKDWEQRKNQIKNLDNGKIWSTLVQEMFPLLRNARLVIVCSVEDIQDLRKELSPPLKETSAKTVPPTTPFVDDIVIENRFWAIKTNALYLGALIANIGFEIELGEKWSLDLPVWYSPYDYTPTRKIRLLATQPELRFWLKNAGEGNFFGLHSHIVGFNVAINDNGRYQDPNRALWGLGLSYGYAMHLDKKKRWSLEFNIGAGFAKYDYDVYRNWINGPKFKSGNNLYWGITRAGISFSYKFYN